MRYPSAVALAALAAALPGTAVAQEQLIDAADTGDTAWLLAASALVLLTVIPGLALFYSGRLRAANALSVVLQCGAIIAAVSLLWIATGYTLAFGNVGAGWFGGGNAWMLIELGNVRDGLGVPESAFVLFQLGFAVLAPALMTGAWAGRARFGWVVGFCALWSLVVYAPVAHWVWGGGWLSASLGTLDFAGGLVVHTSAGVSALVIALLLGRREGFASGALDPHASLLSLAGAALLWVGSFGVAGGFAFAANDDAASAIVNTHAAACAAALAWLLIERITLGKPTAAGFATGVVAGLATIAPAAGFISPGAAVLFGLVSAGLCYAMLRVVKHGLAIDDTLDVFAVHGVGGMLGSLLLAFFLSPAVGGTGIPEGMTLAGQFLGQLGGVAVVAIWSAIASAVLALLVSLVLPMRVSAEAEREGLDFAGHGERAWDVD